MGYSGGWGVMFFIKNIYKKSVFIYRDCDSFFLNTQTIFEIKTKAFLGLRF